MEQKQEAELVFRRVRVIDEAGAVSWVYDPPPVGDVDMGIGEWNARSSWRRLDACG